MRQISNVRSKVIIDPTVEESLLGLCGIHYLLELLALVNSGSALIAKLNWAKDINVRHTVIIRVQRDQEYSKCPLLISQNFINYKLLST